MLNAGEPVSDAIAAVGERCSCKADTPRIQQYAPASRKRASLCTHDPLARGRDGKVGHGPARPGRQPALGEDGEIRAAAREVQRRQAHFLQQRSTELCSGLHSECAISGLTHLPDGACATTPRRTAIVSVSQKQTAAAGWSFVHLKTRESLQESQAF